MVRAPGDPDRLYLLAAQPTAAVLWSSHDAAEHWLERARLEVECRQILAVDPNSMLALANLAEAYKTKGDKDKAIEMNLRIYRLDPSNGWMPDLDHLKGLVTPSTSNSMISGTSTR